jgi:uncharacterized protein
MNLSKQSRDLLKNYSYITESKEYKQLQKIQRHTFTNTYDHSIRVAVLASKISEKIRADIDSTVRVGLLHDFCMIDYNQDNEHEGLYLFYHPKEAIENSKSFHLTKKEERAILTHMFPLAQVPTSKIGWSITLADKLVAVYEKLYGVMGVFMYFKVTWNKAVIYLFA